MKSSLLVGFMIYMYLKSVNCNTDTVPMKIVEEETTKEENIVASETTETVVETTAIPTITTTSSTVTSTTLVSIVNADALNKLLELEKEKRIENESSGKMTRSAAYGNAPGLYYQQVAIQPASPCSCQYSQPTQPSQPVSYSQPQPSYPQPTNYATEPPKPSYQAPQPSYQKPASYSVPKPSYAFSEPKPYQPLQQNYLPYLPQYPTSLPIYHAVPSAHLSYQPHFYRSAYDEWEDSMSDEARQTFRSYAAPQPAYQQTTAYSPPVPNTQCGSNLLIGCAPTVSQVPCSAHNSY